MKTKTIFEVSERRMFKMWSSGLRERIDLQLHTKVQKEHAASICTVEVEIIGCHNAQVDTLTNKQKYACGTTTCHSGYNARTVYCWLYYTSFCIAVVLRYISKFGSTKFRPFEVLFQRTCLRKQMDICRPQNRIISFRRFQVMKTTVMSTITAFMFAIT